MKILKKGLLLALFIFIGMQFYRPEKNTTDNSKHLAVFISETNPPEEVKQILKNTCYDCHSNNTAYPWYSTIAPVSYWLADHIKDGKKHLNFSEWDTYKSKRKAHKLEELIEEVKEGKMPLDEYTWMHSNAILSSEEKEAIIAWAKQTRVLYQLGSRPE